jgi:hypothetical protein
LEQKLAKTLTYAVLVSVLAIGVLAVASGNSFAAAQQPCQVQLGSPNVSNQYYYYGGNFQLTLPVSASCSYYAGQLYATGSAYDTNYGTSVGTTQAVLSSTYGGYGYTGQLTFTLPTSASGHAIQFSVSVYGSQSGYYGGYYGTSLLTQTTSTFVVGPSYYQAYPPSSTYPTYPSYTTPSYPTYPSNPSNYYYGNPRYSSNQAGYYNMGGYYNYYHNSGSYNNYCSPYKYCSHR